VYGTSGEAIVGARLGSTGQLTALTMPMDESSGNLGWLPGTGGLITSLAADPKGRYLYALSVSTSSFGEVIGRNGLSAFLIDRSSGALTLVPGSPYNVPSRGGNIAATGDGQHLVLVANGKMTTYAVDQSSGALSNLSSTSAIADFVEGSWDGQFIFTSSRKGTLAAYKLAADGSVSEVNHLNVQNPGPIVLSYSEKYLYSLGPDGISTLAVSPTGQLTVAQANFGGWQSVSPSRDDNRVYLSRDATDVTPGAIQGFQSEPSSGVIGNSIGPPVTFANGDFPYQIRTDYTGHVLFVTLGSGEMQTYPINSDGSLGSPSGVQGQFVAPQFFVEVP
jgi:6-phosphogluconolactonase (cycloisomerase 2 family)